MKKMFKELRSLLRLLIMCPLFISCSSQKSQLQLLFPLGITYDKVMQDHQIASKKAIVHNVSQDEMKEFLSDIYKPDKSRIYKTYEEDNFDININLDGIICLAIDGYVKDDISYQFGLIFRDDKLVQVIGGPKEDNKKYIVQFNYKILSLNNSVDKVYKYSYNNTSYDWGDSTYETPILLFIMGQAYFEAQYDDMDEAKFTYYSEKIIPLQKIL